MSQKYIASYLYNLVRFILIAKFQHFCDSFLLKEVTNSPPLIITFLYD